MLIITALRLQRSHLWLLVHCQLWTASVICKTVTCGCWDLSGGCLLRSFRGKRCTSSFCWRKHWPVWIGAVRRKGEHRYAAMFSYHFPFLCSFFFFFWMGFLFLKIGYEAGCDCRIYVNGICWSALLGVFI